MKLPSAKVILILVGTIVFFNVLLNTFVWDDRGYIFENPYMPGFNLVNLFSPNTFNSSGYYRPLAAVYFSALYNLFGKNYFFYHLIQVSLHIFIAYLVYELLAQFTKSKIALFLALLFLVHPIQVESVAYIGASQSELFTVFGLLGLYFLRHYSGWRQLFLSVGLFTLSLFVKEVGFLFFILGSLYVVMVNRKWNRPLFIGQLTALAFYLFVRLGLAGVPLQKIEVVRIAQLSLADRLISMPKIIIYYFQTLIFPKNLAVNQHWIIKDINFPDFILPLILVLLIFSLFLIAGVYLHNKFRSAFPGYLFFLIWFILGMGMLLQIFPLDMTVADRWFYFPFIGLLGAIGIFISVLRIPPKITPIFIYLSVFILIVFSVRTIIRNSNYQSDFALYSHDLKLNPDYNLLNDLAMEYLRRGEHQTARDLFQQSVDIYPFDINVSNLGATHDLLGSSQSARLLLQRSINEKSYDTYPHRHLPVVYFNYLNFLMRYHEYALAVDHIRNSALSDYPDNALFYKLLAINEYRLGNFSEADRAILKSWNLLKDPETEKIMHLILSRAKL